MFRVPKQTQTKSSQKRSKLIAFWRTFSSEIELKIEKISVGTSGRCYIPKTTLPNLILTHFGAEWWGGANFMLRLLQKVVVAALI